VKDLLQRLIAQDRALTQRLTMPAGSRWRWLPALGAHLGDGALWFAIGGALLTWGTPAQRRIAWSACLSVLASTGISTAIKYLVRRPRPQELTQFYAVKHDRYAFPSGHATRMGAIAVAIGHWVPQWAPLAYTLATLVALCRVVVGVHYASDVIVGLAIGFVGAGCVLLAS